MISEKAICHHYWVVQHHYLLIQLQLQQRLLLLVVEQPLIEHNMLDNTKHLHPKFVFVVVDGEDPPVELLVVVVFVVLSEPK
jgi:hypothetical protein